MKFTEFSESLSSSKNPEGTSVACLLPLPAMFQTTELAGKAEFFLSSVLFAVNFHYRFLGVPVSSKNPWGPSLSWFTSPLPSVFPRTIAGNLSRAGVAVDGMGHEVGFILLTDGALMFYPWFPCSILYPILAKFTGINCYGVIMASVDRLCSLRMRLVPSREAWLRRDPMRMHARIGLGALLTLLDNYLEFLKQTETLERFCPDMDADSNPNLELYATPVEQQTEWFKASIEYINGNGNNDVLLLEGGDGFVDSVGGDNNHEKEVALVKVDDARIAKLERFMNDNFIPCNDRSKGNHNAVNPGLTTLANHPLSTCSRHVVDNPEVACAGPEMPNDEVVIAGTAIHNLPFVLWDFKNEVASNVVYEGNVVSAKEVGLGIRSNSSLSVMEWGLDKADGYSQRLSLPLERPNKWLISQNNNPGIDYYPTTR
ncbi:hypothetical protein Tco_1525660 [Tanacetum coccineum]